MFKHFLVLAIAVSRGRQVTISKIGGQHTKELARLIGAALILTIGTVCCFKGTWAHAGHEPWWPNQCDDFKKSISDPDGNIRDWSKAVAIDTGTSLAIDLEYRAEAYCAKGQFAPALADMNRAVDLISKTSSDENIIRFYRFFRGDIRMKMGQFDGAITDFKKVIEIDPDSKIVLDLANAYFKQGEYLIGKRDYRGAVQSYNNIIQLPNSNALGFWGDTALADAFIAKAYSQQMLGELIEAAATYTALITLDPEAADPHFARGRVRSAQGDIQGALEDFSAAVDGLPAEAEYRVARSKVYLALGNSEAAVADLDDAAAGMPRAETYLLRGQARRGKHDLKGALSDFDQTIKLDGGSAPAYFSRAFVKAAMNDPDGALADLDTAIRIDAKSPTYFTMRGVVWGLKGSPDKAIADYGSAIALDSNNGQRYAIRGWARFKANQLQDGLTDVNKALVLAPGLTDALLTRGHIYEALGRKDSALADFKAVLAGTPDIVDAKAALKRLGVLR